MRTLPLKLLRDNAILVLPTSVSAWRQLFGAQSIPLSRVCVQRNAGIHVSTADMDVQPRAELYFDCRISRPAGLDLMDLQQQAEAVGAQLGVQYGGVTYRVTLLDELKDGAGRPHHYRLGLN